jgi:NADPH:quinone reductase
MAWGKAKADAALRARVRQLYGELFALFEARKLHPLVDARLPLDKFADALTRVEEREVIGKIVLEP